MRKLTFVVILIFTLLLSSCNRNKPEILDTELLKGQDTVEINTTWIDAGAKLLVGDGTKTMVRSGNVDVTKVGLYEITYNITYLDLDYELIRYVIVTDQTPPDMSLVIGIDTILVDETWIDSGVETSDNSDGIITTIVTGTVDNSTAGTYVIIYTATDESGNISTVTRVVTVLG